MYEDVDVWLFDILIVALVCVDGLWLDPTEHLLGLRESQIGEYNHAFWCDNRDNALVTSRRVFG